MRINAAPQLSLTCLSCGDVYQRTESYVRHNGKRVKFCSQECNGAYTARYKQNRVSARESEFFDRLEFAGLQIERQVRIKHFVVDAVCVNRNVVIEFDGEYWHSFKRVQAKDERKANVIARAGYQLVRVPERSYLDNPVATIAHVLKRVYQL